MEEVRFVKRFGAQKSKSCFELRRPAEEYIVWIRELLAKWRTEHRNLAIANEDASISPGRRRWHRHVAPKKLISALSAELPLVRTQEMQELLEELFALAMDACTSAQRTELEQIIFNQRIVVDLLAHSIKRGLSPDELQAVPLHEWKERHLALLLLDNGSLRKDAVDISKPLIKRWTRFEDLQAPLREDGPLRWLLRLWVLQTPLPSTVQSAVAALDYITSLPHATRSVLRYQSRQFAVLGMEPAACSGHIVLQVVFFFCVLPRFNDNLDMQRQLRHEFAAHDQAYERARLRLATTGHRKD